MSIFGRFAQDSQALMHTECSRHQHVKSTGVPWGSLQHPRSSVHSWGIPTGILEDMSSISKHFDFMDLIQHHTPQQQKASSLQGHAVSAIRRTPHRRSISCLKSTEIVLSMFSDYKGIQLKISNKIPRKHRCIFGN